MPNYLITVEYDGRRFVGWQKQAPGAGRSVQGVLEDALSRLCAQTVTVHGSGRTDAGVHARGQTASFFSGRGRRPEEVVRGGNGLLPPDVAIVRAETVPPEFHARFSARGKVYDYDFLTSPTRRPLRQGRAWWVGPNLDWEAVGQALPALLGQHDFAAFQSSGSGVLNTVRTIGQARLSRPEEELRRLSLEGSGFLRHMVRAVAGLLVEIGRGRLKAASLPEIIASRDRSRAGPTAPPDGLYLARVIYEDRS
ncbi:MAG: tRNA pseudouridine(38-40) synthase TruA [Candidatus Adiutrix sp.]|jgi:tRNA pseudouridine38-40 synthase|nr:tRNA pseudouridine(38-40) synthase TruA [Candidatus Adiutrix sp.]